MKDKFKSNITYGIFLTIILCPLLSMALYYKMDNSLPFAIFVFSSSELISIIFLTSNIGRLKYANNLRKQGKKAIGRYMRFEKRAVLSRYHTYECSVVVEFTDDTGTLREGHTDFCFRVDDIERFEVNKDMNVYYDNKSPKVIISPSEPK